MFKKKLIANRGETAEGGAAQPQRAAGEARQRD
jgi:hypothetical protein